MSLYVQLVNLAVTFAPRTSSSWCKFSCLRLKCAAIKKHRKKIVTMMCVYVYCSLWYVKH